MLQIGGYLEYISSGLGTIWVIFLHKSLPLYSKMTMPISKKREIVLLLIFKGKKLIAIFANSYCGCVYQIHPIYDLYAAFRDGQIILLLNKSQILELNSKVLCGDKNQKRYHVHQFTWECYNGIIPDGKVIDHINDKREDNRLCNLHFVAEPKNSKNQPRNVTIHLWLIIVLMGGK